MREFLSINGRECPMIRDAVKIGNWEEVTELPLSSITKRDKDTATLDGLVVRGYEMEWGKTNENGEQYTREAFDRFIEDYFVGRGFNLVVDIEHAGGLSPEWVAGRILYAETNSRGFFYVAYIPRTYIHYDVVRNMLAEGLLQGFSKMGYATDWEWRYKEDGTFDYELIREFKLFAVSLVSMPANGIAFEKLQEIRRDGMVYVRRDDEEKGEGEMARLFNKKL